MQPSECYELLGLRDGAPPAQVKEAYRVLAKLLHPDLNDSPEAHDAFVYLTEAYRVLRDEALQDDETVADKPAAAKVPAAPAGSAARWRYAPAGVAVFIGLGVVSLAPAERPMERPAPQAVIADASEAAMIPADTPDGAQKPAVPVQSATGSVGPAATAPSSATPMPPQAKPGASTVPAPPQGRAVSAGPNPGAKTATALNTPASAPAPAIPSTTADSPSSSHAVPTTRPSKTAPIGAVGAYHHRPSRDAAYQNARRYRKWIASAPPPRERPRRRRIEREEREEIAAEQPVERQPAAPAYPRTAPPRATTPLDPLTMPALGVLRTILGTH